MNDAEHFGHLNEVTTEKMINKIDDIVLYDYQVKIFKMVFQMNMFLYPDHGYK